MSRESVLTGRVAAVGPRGRLGAPLKLEGYARWLRFSAGYRGPGGPPDLAAGQHVELRLTPLGLIVACEVRGWTPRGAPKDDSRPLRVARASRAATGLSW